MSRRAVSLRCPICGLAIQGNNSSIRAAKGEVCPLRSGYMRSPTTNRVGKHTFHGQCYRQAKADGLLRLSPSQEREHAASLAAPPSPDDPLELHADHFPDLGRRPTA